LRTARHSPARSCNSSESAFIRKVFYSACFLRPRRLEGARRAPKEVMEGEHGQKADNQTGKEAKVGGASLG